MNAPLSIIKKRLEHRFYHRFSVGDTFDLFFDDCVLIAHQVRSEKEHLIDSAVSAVLPEITETTDRSDVAKSTILAATQRVKVESVSVEEKHSLILKFANGVLLAFPTDTEIVDWQWALTPKGGDPYSEFIVGVFDSESIEINECEQAVPYKSD